MEDFSGSDKIIKISGKVDKSDTYNGFSGDISFFIRWTLSTEKVLRIKNEIFSSKTVVSVWFIHFSTNFYYIYK